MDKAKQIKNQEDLIAAKENDLQSEFKLFEDFLQDKEAEFIYKNENLGKEDSLINVQKQQLDTKMKLLQSFRSGNNCVLSKLSDSYVSPLYFQILNK